MSILLFQHLIQVKFRKKIVLTVSRCVLSGTKMCPLRIKNTSAFIKSSCSMESQEKINDGKKKEKGERDRIFLRADEIARLFPGLISVLNFILMIVSLTIHIIVNQIKIIISSTVHQLLSFEK